MEKANPKSTVAPKVHHLNFGMIRCLFRYSTDTAYIKLIVEIWSTAPEAAGRNFPFCSLFTQLLGFSFGFGPASACRSPEGVFWEVWGLLPVFSRCSVGVVLHLDVFLMYLWEGRWSPRLTPPPSWRTLVFAILKVLLVCWVKMVSWSQCFRGYFPDYQWYWASFYMFIGPWQCLTLFSTSPFPLSKGNCSFLSNPVVYYVSSSYNGCQMYIYLVQFNK